MQEEAHLTEDNGGIIRGLKSINMNPLSVLPENTRISFQYIFLNVIYFYRQHLFHRLKNKA